MYHVGSLVRNILKFPEYLERTFLSEKVRKREHQRQQEEQNQENRLSHVTLSEIDNAENFEPFDDSISLRM